MDQGVDSSIGEGVVGGPGFAVPMPARSEPCSGAIDLTPQDDWERNLLASVRDYGVSLSDEAVSSEGIY